MKIEKNEGVTVTEVVRKKAKLGDAWVALETDEDGVILLTTSREGEVALTPDEVDCLKSVLGLSAVEAEHSVTVSTKVTRQNRPIVVEFDGTDLHLQQNNSCEDDDLWIKPKDVPALIAALQSVAAYAKEQQCSTD